MREFKVLISVADYPKIRYIRHFQAETIEDMQEYMQEDMNLETGKEYTFEIFEL